MDRVAFSPSSVEILIVDDVPLNLLLLVDILGGHGYLVRPAINGTAALKAARLRPPHLILLDIMMPDLSGYEVCTRLQADPRTRHIPVIFLSALDDESARAKAFAVGGVDYLIKPVWPDVLLDRVVAWLAPLTSLAPSSSTSM
jgi:CheY-like chemotaxis protein